MTDLVIQSNQSSVILRSLADAVQPDLAYEIPPSFPILAKTYREIQPINQPGNGAPEGKEVAFNLNKANLWRDCMAKTAFTQTTGTVVTQHIGLSLFEKIEIRSNNKVIMTMSDSYILARTQQCTEAKANAIYRRALPLAPITELPTTGVSSVTYTPVFSSFFERVENAFDLNFYEQIQLVFKFNTAAAMGTDALLTATMTLWVWTYKLDDSAYDMLRSKNQNPSRPLNMLCYNTFTESRSLIGTETTTCSFRLNTNYPVFNSYVMIKATTAAGVAALHRIESFDFEVGGTKLLESVPNLVGNWESEKHGASALIATAVGDQDRTDTKCIALNWGMSPMDRVENTGAVSFNQINFPQVTLRYTALAAPLNFKVVVVHEYWQIVSLDSANGSVGITVQS
jgi:hypothetical protein